MNNTLDISRLPKEVLLILEILKEKDKRQKVEYLHSLSKEVDWELFIEYAVHHRVYPMLYRQLKQIQETLFVPTFVIQSLEELYKANTFEMLHLSAEMNEIGKLFADQGIDTLFLKGPILAQDLFGDISLRTSKDLDLLISLDQLDKAQHILTNLGYEQNGSIESLFNEWKWRYKDISYYHPVKRIQVEVHWRLNYWPEKEPTFNELWSRKRVGTITQHPCNFLGREDLFYYLVTHGARHGWFRLRWLADIQKLAEQSIDWQAVYQQFNKYNCIHLGGQALLLATQLNGLNMTDEMQSFLTKRSRTIANSALIYIDRMENLHDPTLSEDIHYKFYRKYHLSILTTSQKVRKMINRLHPGPEDAKVFPLPKPFYFLYFLLRPILYLIRKIKGPVSYRVKLK